MQNAVSSDRIHQVVLETIKEMSNNGKNSLAPENAMEVAVRKISPTSMQHDMDLRNSVLAYWNELLRCGHLGFGICDAPKNWEAGPCFVTEVGRKGLEHADRDPSNPTGYLSYLDREASIDSVTRGYVEESLNAYRAGCYKAAAVLIGAAVESLVLILRDELSARLKSGGKIPKGLDAWQVKTALDAATGKILPDLALEARKKSDETLRKLHEDAEYRLQTIAGEFRRLRNAAGHPASLEPVQSADVHSNLLLFPYTAKLLNRLKEWAVSYYV